MRRMLYFSLLALACAAFARAGDDAAGGAAGAPWTEVPLKFEVSVEFKFRTPKDGRSNASTLRGDWLDVTSGQTPLTGSKGGPIKFEPRQTVVAIDTDGDGAYDVNAKTELFTVLVKRDEGEPTKYAFRLRREYERWWFQRACMAAGEIEKTPVVFIDEDNDGRFDGIGKDVVRVGNALFASYLGKYAVVKGKIYEIQVNAGGTRLKYRPWTAGEGQPGPGSLDLFSGYRGKSRPGMAVVHKVDDPDAYFDCAVKGGTLLPAGEYELVEAIMGPSRDQVCIVEKGKMQNLVVKPGETTKLDWGLPGTFDFQVAKNGNQIQIGLNSWTPYGRAGEKYAHFEPVGMRVGCEVVEKPTHKRIWYGGVDACTNLRLATTADWICRLTCENIDYLGPFQSDWQ